MLLQLFIARVCPVAALGFLKERKQLKLFMAVVLIGYILSLIVAVVKLISMEKWLAILFVPLSMFPHYICYGFAMVILVRCIWKSWSERVWKRIYFFSIVIIMAGVLLEKYINIQILQIFFNFFK